MYGEMDAEQDKHARAVRWIQGYMRDSDSTAQMT